MKLQNYNSKTKNRMGFLLLYRQIMSQLAFSIFCSATTTTKVDSFPTVCARV